MSNYQLIANDFSYLEGWSIHFSSNYEVNFNWSPQSFINCTACDTAFVSPNEDQTYTLSVSDSYGCNVVDEINIEVLPVTDPLNFVECNQISPSSIQVVWNAMEQPFEWYEFKIKDIPPWFVTQDTFWIAEGLESDATHTFQIRTYNGSCYSNIVEVECSTPECPGEPPVFQSLVGFAESCDGKFDGRVEAFATDNSDDILTYYLNGQVTNDGMFGGLNDRDYLVRVVDEDGCGTVDSVNVPAPQMLDYTINVTQISCHDEEDAAIEVVINDEVRPPYTIEWNTGMTVLALSDLSPDRYSFTITDGTECKFSDFVEIADPDSLVFGNVQAQSPDCFGEMGMILITPTGGTLPYSYEWQGSQVDTPNITGDPGMYQVTVSDVNGCSISTNVMINGREELNVVQEEIIAVCPDTTSGLVLLDVEGGVSPYQVAWSSQLSGTAVSGLDAGTYLVTITDVKECQRVDTIEIESYEEVDLTYVFDPPTCFNSQDGMITINSATYSGGDEVMNFSVVWATGAPFETVDELVSDQFYAFTLTDDFGCRHQDSVFLDGPDPINAEIEILNPIECFGDANGEVRINVSVDPSTLDFNWDSGITTFSQENASDISAGIYGVTISDDTECSEEISFELNEPDSLFFDYFIQDVRCFGEENGEIFGDAIGGIPPYDVEWSNGSQGDTLENLAADTYSVTLTDLNGCEFVEELQVTEPEAPLDFEYEATSTICPMTATGVLEIFPSGGTSPYFFNLDSINYFNNSLITGLLAGTHQLIVEDSRGCVVIDKNIVIDDADNKFVDLGGDTTLVLGSDFVIQYDTNIDDINSYEWTVSNNEVLLSCYDCADPVGFGVDESFVLSLSILDDEGCEFTDNIMIGVDDNSFIAVPTGFSPDQNGVNDVLRVYGRNDVIVRSFEIFNRWGELLYRAENFEVNDPTVGWDGTKDGKPLNGGVYVWKAEIIKLNNEDAIFKGNVTLLR